MKRLSTVIIVILVLVCLSSAGYAQEKAVTLPEEATTKKIEDNRLPVHRQDQWQFFVAPYMWVPGMSVNTSFLGKTSSVNAGWYDMVPRLFSDAIGAMGRFEAWKGRWGIYVDSYFSYLGVSGIDNVGKTIDLGRRLNLNIPLLLELNGNLKFISRAASVDFGPRFLVGTVPLREEKPSPILSLEVLGGGRYNFYNQYVKLALNATVTGLEQTRTSGGVFVNKFERSFLEPFLGMRLGLWINPKAVILVRTTVGGFGFAEDHNLDLDMELDVGYKVHKNIYAYAGWRARYVQFSQAALSVNAWLNGPILGMVFAF